MALASSRVMRSSAPVKTTVLPATGDVVLRASSAVTVDVLQQFVHHVAVMRLAEELHDGLGHDLADAVDGVEFAPGLALHRRAAAIICSRKCSADAIGPGQCARRRLAHMADAEREDEAVERDGAARVDGVEQLARHSPRPSPRGPSAA